MAPIIPLLLQRGLDVGDNLIRRQVVISVDRAVISVIGVGRVTPRWVPPAGIPVEPSTECENDTVVMTVPPTPLVPHRPVIPESIIIGACPPLASRDASILLEFHAFDMRRARLGLKFEFLSLIRFPFP